MEEKRQFTRIQFDAEAFLEAEGSGWHTQVMDISLHGALVVAPEECSLRPGNTTLLVLILSDGVTEIYLDGTVRYAQNGKIGLEFGQIEVESASHLRRLVELNVGDPALLERELEALWKIGQPMPSLPLPALSDGVAEGREGLDD